MSERERKILAGHLIAIWAVLAALAISLIWLGNKQAAQEKASAAAFERVMGYPQQEWIEEHYLIRFGIFYSEKRNKPE